MTSTRLWLAIIVSLAIAFPLQATPPAKEQANQSAAELLCSNAPDKDKCEEFVEKRLGEASDNIDPVGG